MAGQNVKMVVPGLGPVEGTAVQIAESVERWTVLKLEDSSVLRVKPTIVSVVRLDGRYDPQGNPMYAVQGGQIMVVDSAPEHLRQPTDKAKIQ